MHALNSEHAQNALWLLWMPIGWNLLGMPTIVCVCIPFGRVYFKARGVKKDSVLDMIKVELTYVPIKGGIVYPDVNRFFYSMARPWSSLPMLKLSGVELCPVCRLCTWMVEGFIRCSLYLSPRALDVSRMYSSLHTISTHW